ncbi:MAG: hypothetical protein H6Q90_3866 [Deltaproteobacteria bacterium]|nr:hypothetical protein [Deltaproteobacteria bacterium]
MGGIPHSAPGTIFGIPVSRLSDASLQRKVLFLAGVALIVSIVVPMSISPLRFPFSSYMPLWRLVIFPIIAGAAYLLVAAAPPNLRQQIPPAVLQWIPFGISFWGILTLAPLILGGTTLYAFAYVILLFGLLSRIAKPSDQTARVVIAIGAGLLFIPFLSMIGPAFSFHGGALQIVGQLLQFLVTALGVFCVVFVIPPQKLPPALQAIDAFGPAICAILLLWLPAFAFLMAIDGLIHGSVVGTLLMFARMLLYLVAFLGVVLMSSPSVYEAMFAEPVMRRKQLGTVLLLLVPLFLIYWLVETKNQMQKRTGEPVISGWWIAVPGGIFYFLWKWSQGVHKATGYEQMTAFLLMLFIAPVGVWIIQPKFNALEGGGAQPGGYGGMAAGGGYPPPGGGYPPQGGGYPPQGGGYPPQGGGYPPPGGGYPPPA